MDGDQIAPSEKTRRKKKTEMVITKKQLQQQLQPQQKVQLTQAKCPQTLNYQKPQSSQKFNQKTSDGQYPSQSEICKQWEAEMKRLNIKYNLDCFSDSELNSESDEGEQYKYEHGYETLIWKCYTIYDIHIKIFLLLSLVCNVTQTLA